MNLSRLNRATHRDVGYFIVGMTLIYALSGIALNHKNDWNPNYIYHNQSFTHRADISHENFSEETALGILRTLNLEKEYKTSYFPKGDVLTIFVEGGLVNINTRTGEGLVQMISKRPFFYELNFLHYNPGKWWKYFSDFFCVSLILVTITGLFIIKGRNGIKERGAILVLTGILLPLLFLLIVY